MVSTPDTLTSTERVRLKHASGHPLGHLPTVTRKLLHSLSSSGCIYREDVDGYRLDLDEAFTYDPPTPWRITTAGRLAVLSPAQVTALTERVNAEGRFTSKATWATTRSLAELRLAEYRDADGQVQPNDGDDGVHGPQYLPYRTTLGRTVADLVEDDLHQ
jgi:hypothetical protein